MHIHYGGTLRGKNKANAPGLFFSGRLGATHFEAHAPDSAFDEAIAVQASRGELLACGTKRHCCLS